MADSGSLVQSYQVRHSGRDPGSDKIRYYQSSTYSSGEKAYAEPYVVSGAYSQGAYGPGTGSGHYTSSSSSAPKSARKYEVDRERGVSPGNSRTCILVIIIVGITILAAAAIALGIVFGVVNKAGDKDADTTTARPETAVAYETALTLDQPYRSNYADPTTTEYQDLKNQVEPEVNDAMRESDLSESFIDAELTGIKPGSAILLFSIHFSKSSVKIANDAVTLTKELVQTELKKELNKMTAFIQAQKLKVEQTVVSVATNTGRKDLGETCSVPKDCSDSHTKCQGSKCTCIDGYYHSNNNPNKGGTCIRMVEYEETGCTEGRHCKTSDAICLSAQCQCAANTKFHKTANDACVDLIELDQSGCSQKSHCADSWADCTAGKCLCPANRVNKDNHCKLRINKLGCAQASDCATTGAQCTSLLCKCPSGKYDKNYVCVDQIAIYKDGCDKNSACITPGAECRSGTCRCPLSKYLKNGQCVDKIAINMPGCTDRFQCATSGAECETGTCRCPDSHDYRNGRCMNKKSCGEWYYEKAIYMNCLASAIKIGTATSADEKCRHYENFLGCCKYQSLVDDVECSFEELVSFSPGNSLCPGHDYDYLDGQMPTEKTGLCGNKPTARYMLEYGCLTYDPQVLQSDADRCRVLYTLEGCMLGTLQKDVGCHLVDVVKLLRNQEVRAGILDAIPLDCESKLQLTSCEMFAYREAILVQSQCFYAPSQFHFATILQDVNELKSYDTQRKLKCSVYEAAIDCLITSRGGNLQCYPSDLAQAMKDSMRIFYDVIKANPILPDIAKPLFKLIDFSECDAGLSSTTIPTPQCPSSGTVADLVVAACVAQIYEGTRVYQQHPCLRLKQFGECLGSMAMPHAELCREDHFWKSFGDHAAFISSSADGFDPVFCKEQSSKKCSVIFAEQAKYQECQSPYEKMIQDPTENRCRHFEAFLSCLKFHAMLYEEDCTFQTLRDLVKATSSHLGDSFDICNACDFGWEVKDDSGALKGYVDVRLEMTTENAVISGKAYGLGMEWVGVGISVDDQLSNSDIYSVQPLARDGEEWILVDRYAGADSDPKTDTSQGGSNDPTLKILESIHGNGIVQFTRKIDTQDPKDVTIAGDRYLLFARGPMTGDIVLDLGDVTFLKVSDKITFQCSAYNYLESIFPSTKISSCTNPALHRHLWEYDCLEFDFTGVSDANDRCRLEISRRGCVFKIFQDAQLSCTMEDVITMSQLPYVRFGLLDHVERGCESQLSDTPCEKQFWNVAAERARECFIPLYNLQNLVFYRNPDVINGYTSAGGQKTLKCSLYEQLLKCYLTKVPTADDGTTCTASDLAPAVTKAAHVYFGICCSTLNVAELSYQSCEGLAADEVPVRACPSTAAVADMVIGKCAALVIGAIASTDACTAKGAFEQCMGDFYVPNLDLCEEKYVERAFEEHGNKIKEHLGGFDYYTCTDDIHEEEKKCSEEYIDKVKHSECAQPYNKLMTASDESEKCRHFGNFLACAKYNAQTDGEECPIKDLETKAKARLGQQYSLCKSCESVWVAYDANGNSEAEVIVHVGKETDDATTNYAVITMKAYDFNEDADWVGLGVSHSGSMDTSDIYTAQKKNGQWIVTDRYAPDKSRPRPDSDLDASSDAMLLSARIINGNALITFTRKIDTGDSKDLTLDVNRHLLFARGPLNSAGDISRHTFKKAWPVHQFQCSPYEQFEAGFPSTPGAICDNPGSHRYNWEYMCMVFDMSHLTSEHDRCRTELGRRFCVYMSLKEMGCTMEQVTSMALRPEVRLGLLDHTDPGCEANLPDSACEKFYYTYSELSGYCFSPLIYFYEYATATTDTNDEIDGIIGHDGQKSLKCSLVEEVARCIIVSTPNMDTANVGNTACTPADVSPALDIGLHVYNQIAKNNVNVRKISLQNCQGGVSTTVPTEFCPSKSAVADLIVVRCVGEILDDIGQGKSPCGTFDTCSHDIEIRSEHCPYGYIEAAIWEYKDYLKIRFGNQFDPCLVEENN